MNKVFSRYICILILSVLASCSTTKFVPEGSYLLDEIKVVSESKEVKASPMKDYVRQRPNSKWFNLVKVPLYTYSLSGRDSTKWFNKFLRRMGDAPVIYDENVTLRSEEEITKALNNMGYMSASVSSETKVKKKKLKLTYKLNPGEAYHVRSFTYDIPDKEIERYVLRDSVRNQLVEGMVFDVNVLDSERQRITDLLLRRGYYRFNKEYITYTADTAANTRLVDLTLHLLPFNDSISDHYRYRINKVGFILDYDAFRSNSSDNVNLFDSITYKGFPVYFNEKPFLRPRVLYDNNRIVPGRYYNEQLVQNTYSSFGRLRALKFTNIRFVETTVNDSTLLDAYIMLTRGKYKSVSTELEGTNSAGDLGAAASVSFQHRNLFRGSETFTIKLRGAYEAISYSDNYTEYGVETSLNFPSFMFPFLSSDFKRRIRATSEVGLKYNSQIRPEFSRTVASASWGYRWTNRQRTQHVVDFVDLNYAYMSKVSDGFKERQEKNNILKYTYADVFIVRTGYRFNYNSIGNLFSSPKENSFTVRTNIETGGNLLNAFSHLINQKKSEDGSYKIANIAYAQYVKGDFDFAKNIKINDENSFAFHIGLGIACPYGNSQILPFEKRYFSGGANSIRGWSVRSLGPGSFKGDGEKIDYMHQSGDIKLDLNIEYRTYLFWKLYGAAFIDAGNIWTIKEYKGQEGGQFRFDTFYKQIAASYGLGIRFDFDFFILRFDGGMKAINPAYPNSKYQFPIIRPKFSRDFAFHFAVGYPF